LFALTLNLILLFSMGLAAAAPKAKDMVLDLGADLRGVERLSSNQLQEDLEFLKAAVQKGYAGPDLQRVLNALPTPPTNSQNFCDLLAGAFAPVRDAHLKASLEFKGCGRRTQAGRVGKNIAESGWLLKSVEHQGQQISVLAIPEFWPKYDARWNGFLAAVRSLRQQNRPFVIDLRGNSGGDDAMGFEMARILLGLPEHVNLPSPVVSRTFRQTPEAFALQSNHWAWSILRLKNLGRPVPEYMKQRREEILNWMERAENGEFPKNYIEHLPEVELDRRQVFSPPVFVLIDRGCASSCETTLQVLEQLPQRILVGENTMGAVEFGDMGRVVLPNSRVSVSLSTMNVEFRDGRRVEKVGYAPTLPVRAGGDALVAALDAVAEPD